MRRVGRLKSGQPLKSESQDVCGARLANPDRANQFAFRGMVNPDRISKYCPLPVARPNRDGLSSCPKVTAIRFSREIGFGEKTSKNDVRCISHLCGRFGFEFR